VVTGAKYPQTYTQNSLKGVKLAYAPKEYLELVDHEVEKKFKETIYRLRDAGAEVVEIDLGKDFLSLANSATMDIFFRETKEAVEGFLKNNNVPIKFDDLYKGLKPYLKNVWGNFVLPNGAGYISQETYETDLNVVRSEIKRRFDEAFVKNEAQAIIFPTTPCTAPLIAHQDNFLLNGKEVSYMVLANNTIPTSAAGLPGISIPIGLSSNKLPIGLEIDGPYGQDISLLIIARKIEAVVGALS
jgi:mandelamide amidase